MELPTHGNEPVVGGGAGSRCEHWHHVRHILHTPRQVGQIQPGIPPWKRQLTMLHSYVQKYALWTAFNVTQAAILTPLMFMSPAILARAGLYTVGMMGSIAFIGATAKQEKYLYLGGPLLAGVAIVAISGFAPLVLPATAVRTLAWTENIWLYGGLAVFGGFTLYDVQKILHHARMSERGLVRKDVVNESVSLELDFINIFVRMVQILGMRNNNRR